MKSKHTDTRNRILDLAERLIRCRGYNGFSYKNISSELRVKNAAIHYHFPAKKDLGVAVIQRAQVYFREWELSVSNSEVPPLEMLMKAFGIFRNYLDSEETVCLGGALETDFGTFPEEMQEAITGLAEEILKWLSSTLAQGRRMGAFSFDGLPEEKAFQIASCLQGALQIARVTKKENFYKVIAQIQKDLGISANGQGL